MARFKGNVHASSDRAGATFLFVLLILVVLFVFWWQADYAGFTAFWDNLGRNVQNRTP